MPYHAWPATVSPFRREQLHSDRHAQVAWQTSPEAHRLFCHSRNSMLYILLSLYLLAITTAQVRKLTEFAGVSNPNIPSEEWNALNDLYQSTRGSDWTWRNLVEWNFTDPTVNPCTEQWGGLNCSFTPPYQSYYIVGIFLTGFDLAGPLPDSIGSFQHLLHLRLDGNSITGTLPAAIGNLTNLAFLRLQGNWIQGTIPAELGRLAALRELYLENNKFIGTIPSALGGLSNLTTLELGTNRLTGTLPSSLGQLVHLQHAIFYYNNLTGTIPESIGAWTNLSTFNVYNNSLTGTLPIALCALKTVTMITVAVNAFSQTLPSCLSDLPRLIYLDLFSNALTGSIPASFAQMRRLNILYLNRNQMTGPIDVLCDMPSLGQIYLEDNKFTGTLPDCLSNLSNLTSLYLAANAHLHGTIPESWGGLSRLKYIDLSANAVSGALPQSFAELSQLRFLYLFNNQLTGTVPQAYSQLRYLTLLLLQNNRLGGPVEKLFNTTVQRQLDTIQLSGNAFTGELPGESLFARSPGLTMFSAVDNCFHGSVPAALCSCVSLRLIALDGASSSRSCNQDILPGVGAWQRTKSTFGGKVPTCLFQMPNLTILHLSGNRLTGSLPSNLTLGPHLAELALTHNSLSGDIPRSIQRRVWRLLDLSYNRFSGTLDEAFNTLPMRIAMSRDVRHVGEIERGLTSNNTYLSLESNRLSGRIPHAVFELRNLTILTGNLFACNWEETDLPAHDSGRSGYECGSGAVNSQLYAYHIAVGITTVLVVLLYQYRVRCHQYLDVQSIVDNAVKWLFAVHQPALQAKLPGFKRVCDTADLIGRVAMGSAVLIVVILVPMYAILTHFCGTVTYQYAWSISAAFVSGAVPFVLESVAYLIILVAPLYLMQFTEYSYLRQLANIPQDANVFAPTAAIEEVIPVGTVTRTQVATAYLTFFVVNLIIVAGVNAAFVVIALSGNKAGLAAAQLFLSFFKGAWNSVGSAYLLSWSFRAVVAADPSKAAALKTHLAASLFNNIGIPCLVVAAISPDCIYHVFYAPHATGFQYVYATCAIFLGDQCLILFPTIASTSYTPPFTYSYECGAQYIIYYAPTFVYLALEVALVIPVCQVLLTRAHFSAAPGGWWDYVLRAAMCKSLLPLGAASDFDSSGVLKTSAYQPFFDARQLIVLLLTYLALLLSFGMVFPPIAVVMAIAVVSMVITNRMMMGRYLSNALELQETDNRDAAENTAGPEEAPPPSEEALGTARMNRGEQYIRAVELDSRKIGTLDKGELRSCVSMVLMCCCLFYTIFFYDTLGDAYGMRASAWVFAAWPMVPVVIFASGQWLKVQAQAIPQKESLSKNGPGDCSEDGKDGNLEMRVVREAVNPLASYLN